MKKIIFTITCLLIMLTSKGQGVSFEELNLNDAIKKAKTENKYIFIDFYTSWCGPCKLMDAQVFPQKAMGDYLNNKFVSLKINAESGVEGPTLANKYKISAYPTFVILDNNGNLVNMFAGGILEPIKFINKIEDSFNDDKSFGKLKEKYESGNRDKKLVSNYLQALIETNTTKPDSLVNEFYNSLSDKEKISKETTFIFERFAPLDSEKEIFFEKNRNKFREVIGNQKVDSILVSKYELYFGSIAKGYTHNATVEKINEKSKHLESLGISNLKTIPVYKAAALLQLTDTGKEDFLKQIDKTLPNLTSREKDLMFFIIIPGLRKKLTEEEKTNLLNLVTDDSVKGYIIRSIK